MISKPSSGKTSQDSCAADFCARETAKPHGFPNEHFVVIPRPIVAQAGRHPLLSALHVTDAGHFPKATGHRVVRPKGIETHLIFACLRGRGWVQGADQDARQTIEAGDVVWLPAGKPHAYGADKSRPWTLTYAHFSGREADAWMRHSGWRGKSPERFHLPRGREQELQLDRVYAVLERGYDERHQVEAAAALRSSLAVLGRLLAEAGPGRSARERIAAVRDRLRNEPARNFRLEELASEAGLSVPRFTQLFREVTGTSAGDYGQRLRIQRASQLLAASEATVADIAAAVGYEDPFYFARCFRKVMGLSPRAYRNQCGWTKKSS